MLENILSQNNFPNETRDRSFHQGKTFNGNND